MEALLVDMLQWTCLEPKEALLCVTLCDLAKTTAAEGAEVHGQGLGFPWSNERELSDPPVSPVSCRGARGGGRPPWEWLVCRLPAGEAGGAAEHEVDEGVDGAVQGWQVLDDHRRVEALPGVRKEAEVVQHVEEEVGTPAADEGWGEQGHQHPEAPAWGMLLTPRISQTHSKQSSA